MRKTINIPGAPKVLTDDEKYQQLQTQLEVQLGRLQTEYCLLSHDHELAQYSKANKLKTYNRVLSVEQKEDAEILTNLNVAKCKKKIDEKLADNLKLIVEEYDDFTADVSTAKKTLSQIQDQIKMVKKRVLQLSSLQVTDRQIQERAWRAAKTVETLENKLDVQIKKFCTIVSKNHEMRREIDYLLVDRTIFYQIWTKFIDRLVNGKKIMMDIIEQATIAYDQREEWVHKLQALRNQAQIEMQQRLLEIRSLSSKQIDQLKLQEFLDTKTQRRYMRDLMLKRRELRDTTERELREKVEHYENMIQDITTFSEDSRLGSIALKYKQQEQKNFMYFRYIIDQIKSMESVNDELTDLHEKIDEARVLTETRRIQQVTRLDDLEKELETAREERDNTETAYKKIDSYYDTLLKGINQLFHICKCKNDPLLELLGNNTQIHCYNAELYMQILENAVLEYYMRLNYIQTGTKVTQKKSRSSTTFGTAVLYHIDDLVAHTPCALCVEYEMVVDSTDKVVRVFSRNGAKRQLQHMMKHSQCQFKLHNISKCQMPKARELVQKRYIN